jgi:hypothetical protein
MNASNLPSSPKLEQAIIDVLRKSAGALTNEEITEQVIQLLSITTESLQLMHTPSRTELDYRLAWARTRASKKNLIERTAPKTWKIKI